MAIQKTITTKGVTIPDAYVKVFYIAGGKHSVSYQYEIKADEDSPPFDKGEASFIPDVDEGSANFLVQAYEHLKKKETFLDSVDI